MDDTEKKRKRVVDLITAELKRTFRDSSELLSAITELESEGVTLALTIVSAVEFRQNSSVEAERADVTSTMALAEDEILSEDDRRFLRSMKLTF
jgi:hypothetical protein